VLFKADSEIHWRRDPESLATLAENLKTFADLLRFKRITFAYPARKSRTKQRFSDPVLNALSGAGSDTTADDDEISLDAIK